MTKRARKIAPPTTGAATVAQPPAPRPRGAHVAAVAIALALVTLFTFRGVLSNGFVNYDDYEYVSKNAHLRGGLNADSIAWAFTTTACANWHPVTWLSHLLDVQLLGLDAGRHHGTSLLLHTANAVLLLLLLVRMTGALWRSALVAALFALHPLHVESVAWLAERKDVLSTLFWLLTTAAWLRYLASRTVLRYVLVMVLFGCGLMAKPMLVTLPFTLLLLDHWPLRRFTLPAAIVEKAPLFALSAASCVATFVAQRIGDAVQPLDNLPLAERVANALLAYAAYLGKTLWPAALAIFYPHRHLGLAEWSVAASLLLLAGITALVVKLRDRAPYLTVGWLWYLGTLVPVIGLVQVGGQAMADRYTYVPLIGVFIAIAWGLGDIARRERTAGRVVAAAAVVALAALGAAARVQVGHWANTVTLFEQAIRVTSNNALAHYNLGAFFLEHDNAAAAIPHLQATLAITSDNLEARFRLGDALEKTGAGAEARDQYERAAKLAPDYPGAFHALGRVLVRLGRVQEAIAAYERALQSNREFAEARNDLGVALAMLGRRDEAIVQFETALRTSPDPAGVHVNLGRVLLEAGRHDAAAQHYVEALRLRPDHVDALNGLGLILAAQQRWPEAIERFHQALAVDPASAEVHNNLGFTLARNGRIAEAREEFLEAVRRKPDFEDARANLRSAERLLQGHP